MQNITAKPIMGIIQNASLRPENTCKGRVRYILIARGIPKMNNARYPITSRTYFARKENICIKNRYITLPVRI